MNNNKYFVGLIVIAIIAIGAYMFPTGNTVVERVVERVGALSGPDIQSEYLSVNGVSRWYRNVGLTQATSTICAIQSPAATSTLVSGSVHIDRNTTASQAVIAKSANAFASTTLLGYNAIAAATELNLVASTTPISAGALTFGPNTYMTVSLQGSGAVSLGGECHAVFEQLTD